VSADTPDGWMDVYERRGEETTLISTGPAGGNGAFDAFFNGASADGTRIFFETDEPLVTADTDAASDLYERAGAQVTLLSTGPDGGNGDVGAFFDGASADGTRVVFETEESLLRADTDAARDLYAKSIPAPETPPSPSLAASGGPPAGRVRSQRRYPLLCSGPAQMRRQAGPEPTG
jgi:hypothetical protein